MELAMSNAEKLNLRFGKLSSLLPRSVLSGGMLLAGGASGMLVIAIVLAALWLQIHSLAEAKLIPPGTSEFAVLVDHLKGTAGEQAAVLLRDWSDLFSSDDLAAGSLFLLAGFALSFRWALLWAGQSLCEGAVSASVFRLRQQIHDRAIRLDSADLNGQQRRLTEHLFNSAATQLEVSAAEWFFARITLNLDLVFLLLTAAFVDWRVAIEIVFPVIICWLALRMESEQRLESSQLLAEQEQRELQRLAEGLRKSRVISGFAMESFEQQLFKKHLLSFRARCRKLRSRNNRRGWLRRLFLLAGILLPGFLLTRHALSPDTLPLFVSAVPAIVAFFVFRTLKDLDQARQFEREGNRSYEEILSYLGTAPQNTQPAGTEFLDPMTRSLQFDQVCFSTTQNSSLLHHLDLRIYRGEIIGLISLNREAAYALASMVPRFVDPDSGQVLIDGRDIRLGTLESLRAEAIFVGACDQLFNTSVVENIVCGQAEITRQQVIEACKVVHADHFIRNLSRGYEAVLGEHGTPLDAGQIFRICLARAVVRNPAILIIEEPGDPFDAETKSLLADAYQRVSMNRTVLFLPSRLSTIRMCHRVVLIHNGKVAADDCRDQLVQSSELYRHWEYVNFNDFRGIAQGQSGREIQVSPQTDVS
jgi:ATP-binding cassette subfamily B protein